MMTSCPNEELLFKLLSQRLDPPDSIKAAEHVDRCVTCQENIERLLNLQDSQIWRPLASASLPAVDPAPFAPPSLVPVERARPVVPGYEILEELGRGGIGVVYKARHLKLNRLVALKMILAGAHADAAAHARLRAEAETIARLQHPHIVQVFEVGIHDGITYLALEYCGGGTLAAKFGDQPASSELSASLLETLARTMHAAHHQGIIHRDLKPANVLLTDDGSPKIGDFDLARQTLDSVSGEGRTASGVVVGTPSYMAPEQARGQPAAIGPATDVYALGALLYRLLTGRPPFLGATNLETCVQVIHYEPVSLRRLQPAVPADLETICLKCLDKIPGRRYESAAALADDLQRFRQGKPIHARPVSRKERLWRWCRRHPAIALLTLGLTVSFLVGFATTIWQWQRAEDRAERHREARDDATTNLRKSERQEAQLAFNQGITLCDQGQVDRGLLWLTRSLQLAMHAGAQNLERPLRINLADWLQQLSHAEHVCFHPNAELVNFAEHRLVTAGPDRRLRFWDTENGIESSQPITHPENPNGPQRLLSLAVSRDGKTMLTTTRDGQARLWDVAMRRQSSVPLVHPINWIWDAAFHPDGRRVLTIADDGVVRTWNIATGQQEGIPFEHSPGGRGYHQLAVDRDGSFAATLAFDGRVKLWDLKTGNPIGAPLMHAARPTVVAFLGPGKKLVTGTRDGGIFLWEEASAQVRALPGQGSAIVSLAVSGDGRLLVTASRGGVVRLWDTAMLKQVGPTFRHERDIAAVALRPDGKVLAILERDGTARTWRLPQPQSIGPALRPTFSMPLPREPDIHLVAYTADGKRILSGCRLGAHAWGTNGQLLFELPLNRTYFVQSTSVSGDGRWIATARFAGKQPDWRGAVDVWDAATGAARFSVDDPVLFPDVATFAALDNQGTAFIAGTGAPGQSHRWSLAEGKCLGPCLRSITARIQRVLFSPDDKTVLVACADQRARFIDLMTDREVGSLDHSAAVTALAYDAKGERVLTGCRDGTARVWDVAKRRLLMGPLTHEGEVAGVAFSPDGTTLLTGSHDGTALFWDASTGQRLGPALRHADAILSVSFHPSGKRVVTGSYDQTAQQWRTPAAPIEGRFDVVRSRIELATGLRLDARGTIRVLSNDEIYQRKNALAD